MFKDKNNNKIEFSKKTKILSVISVVLIIAISFGCGYFTYHKSLGTKTSVNWVMDMIKDKGCYYSEDGDLLDISDEEFCQIILGSLDDYSKYYTKAEYLRETEIDKGNQTGIGISFKINDGEEYPYSVSNVVWNSPAEKNGIKVGDIFVKAKVLDTETDFSTNSPKTFLYNLEEDTELKITVKRGEEHKEITLTKQDYKMAYVKYYDSDSKLCFVSNGSYDLEFEQLESLPLDTALIKLRLFQGDSAEAFKNAVSYMIEQGKSRLILDLRNNGGGDMSVLKEIASYLVEDSSSSKTIIAVAKNNKGEKESFKAEKRLNSSISKISVVANENTASASECLIGAMLYYGEKDTENYGKIFSLSNLVIEGGRTFGKGIMQTTYKNILTGEAVKLTTAKIYWPDEKTSIHKTGITVSGDNNVEPNAGIERAKIILSN